MTQTAENTEQKQPCPTCDARKNLAAMDYSPETIQELADSQPCPDFVGDQTYRLRMSTCEQCPSLIGGMTCSQCGCFVQFRAKHATARCALGKW